MRTLLEHSVQSYGPLPPELRPCCIRSRTSSQPWPYPPSRISKSLVTNNESIEGPYPGEQYIEIDRQHSGPLWTACSLEYFCCPRARRAALLPLLPACIEHHQNSEGWEHFIELSTSCCFHSSTNCSRMVEVQQGQIQQITRRRMLLSGRKIWLEMGPWRKFHPLSLFRDDAHSP